jgi:hypothetical protein
MVTSSGAEGTPRARAPEISIVFGVHDPSYAGDLLGRTRTFLGGLIALANRNRLPTEIVVVEWNPHPRHAPFREGLSWPDALGGVELRFIEVPAEIHHRLPNADRIPIFEYVAKNVGIRRARGRYLVATNPDLFYSAALVKVLAGSALTTGRFYRVDRSDLSAPIPDGGDIDGQLSFCREHIARVHAYFGSYDPRAPASGAPSWKRVLKEEYAALRAGRSVPDHPREASDATLVSPPDGLHRNAAGDFFLMERRHWLDLGGYPELYTHAHIDAIMCWIAASAGLRQTILPSACRLYHQPHERGAHATFPTTDWRPWYERYLEAVREMGRIVVNDPDWGLAREELHEWRGGPRQTLVACDPHAVSR